MEIVTHYGIHWDENIAFLLQGRGGTNAVGLKKSPPFVVRLASRKKHCNHQIPLATPVPNDFHWDAFVSAFDDQLVKAMMPFPKVDAGVVFLKDDEELLTNVLFMLSRMSSPIFPIVIPMWMTNLTAVVDELSMTNVQPLVITGVKPKDSDFLRKVCQAAVHAPRRLIVTGASDVLCPPTAKRIETELLSAKYDFNELNMLPWEALGATALRKWMRGEDFAAGPAAVKHMERNDGSLKRLPDR